MGIVVCIVMLLGLVVLRPTPWRAEVTSSQAPKFVLFTAVLLFTVGAWNLTYGYLSIDGFWQLASVISGITMIVASILVMLERERATNVGRLRTLVIVLLALSFLLYAVTLIQLNLGYPILR
jgi:hypothetical protein